MTIYSLSDTGSAGKFIASCTVATTSAAHAGGLGSTIWKSLCRNPFSLRIRFLAASAKSGSSYSAVGKRLFLSCSCFNGSFTLFEVFCPCRANVSPKVSKTRNRRTYVKRCFFIIGSEKDSEEKVQLDESVKTSYKVHCIQSAFSKSLVRL